MTTSECHEICVRRHRLTRIPVADTDIPPPGFKAVVMEESLPNRKTTFRIQCRIGKHLPMSIQ